MPAGEPAIQCAWTSQGMQLMWPTRKTTGRTKHDMTCPTAQTKENNRERQNKSWTIRTYRLYTIKANKNTSPSTSTNINACKHNTRTARTAKNTWPWHDKPKHDARRHGRNHLGKLDLSKWSKEHLVWQRTNQQRTKTNTNQEKLTNRWARVHKEDSRRMSICPTGCPILSK